MNPRFPFPKKETVVKKERVFQRMEIGLFIAVSMGPFFLPFICLFWVYRSFINPTALPINPGAVVSGSLAYPNSISHLQLNRVIV